MTTIDSDGLACGSIPDMYGTIAAGRSKKLLLGRPDQRVDGRTGVTLVGHYQAIRRYVPYASHSIGSSSCNAHATRRPSYSSYSVSNILIDTTNTSTRGLPYMY